MSFDEVGFLAARAIHLRAAQTYKELVWVIETIRSFSQPEYVLEIGSEYGGTMWLWSRLATDDAWLVGIDDGSSGVPPPFHALLDKYPWPARDEQRLRWFQGDSRDPDVINAARDLGPYDLLLIDGGHFWENISADWENYTPLVRSGGLVILHDIGPPAGIDVGRFWRERVCPNHETAEFILEQEILQGTGIVMWP